MRKFPGEQLTKNACTQLDVLSHTEWANTGSGFANWQKVFTLPDQRRDHLLTGKWKQGSELHLCHKWAGHCPLRPSASLPVKGFNLVSVNLLRSTIAKRFTLALTLIVRVPSFWISVSLVLKWEGHCVERILNQHLGTATQKECPGDLATCSRGAREGMAAAQPALSPEMPKLCKIHPKHTGESA